MNSIKIDAAALFRMPWTMADNAMTWLEPTRECNITCDACFAQNDPGSQKSLAAIKAELTTMLELRRCDAMLIAGGEPLTHPQITEITELVKAVGVKPVIVTNGVNLTPEKLKELKRAGLRGITFHVDSHQNRPGWTGKNEKELNELRQFYADMMFKEGGLTCSFNTTIFPDTLEYVPDIVTWTAKNIDRVQVLSLIAVRIIDDKNDFDFYAGDKKIDMSTMPYSSPQQYRNLSTQEIYDQLKTVLPDFSLCAFIGGTLFPHSLKWTIGCNIGTTGKSFGSFGSRSMEFFQNFNHFTKKRYLAFTHPKLNRKGRSLLLFSLFDRTLRQTARKYRAALFKKPRHLFKRLYTQSISIMQPIDIQPNGEIDICDGCPNKTLWEGRLVSSCRLDDYKAHGTLLHAVPKQEGNTREGNTIEA